MGSGHAVYGAVLNNLSHDPVWASNEIAVFRQLLARQCRNSGHGKAVTASVTSALGEDGILAIALNLGEHNLVAKSIYEKLGIVIRCQFIEGLLRMIWEAEPQKKGRFASFQKLICSFLKF